MDDAAVGVIPEKQRRFFSLIRRDIDRYFYLDGYTGRLQKLRVILDSPGAQSTIVYRFGYWINHHIRFRPIQLPLNVLYYLLDKLAIICWGIHIHPDAEIGGGLYIGHYGGIIIGRVRMGEDCNIAQQVTMGMRADGVPGVPQIGNRVWIGAGSILFGNIHIGDGVTIAPLTVVSRSLPPRAVVIGNPMRVLRLEYDNSAEIYGRRPSPEPQPHPAD